jgi:hypothetical protein
MRSSGMKFLAAGLAAGVILSGMVTAIAAIPDSTTGKITACYAKVDGTVRVINAQNGQNCRKSERKLVWNQRGPKGATGARGPLDDWFQGVGGCQWS